RSAAGVDVFVHPPARGPTLRRVQQMRGAAAGLRRGRADRPHPVPHGATMFSVTRELTFCYGHRLLDYDGKCRHLHGHNGRAVITLASAALDPLGMVMDFSRLKRVVGAWIDIHLDH